MDTDNAIEMRHVCKSFKDFTLQDVSLTLPKGGVLGLIGENGAGKSTSIRLIMHALKCDSGEIFVLGQDNTDAHFRDLKEDIGVVLDEAYFPEVLNIEQVTKVLACTYKNWDPSVFSDYLKTFDLPEKRAFKDFSRGMKMKFAIAAALSHHARLLILDEATSGLDPIMRDDILDVFATFVQDKSHAILLSSHILSDLEKICDHVAFIHKGKLLFCEEKNSLLDTYGIITCTEAELSALPAAAVIRIERKPDGTRALVRRSEISSALPMERASIEDIILFQVKGVEPS